jgi:hypothetical protein
MDYTQTLRRATTGRSVLGWVALACLVLNGGFWGTLMIDLLEPPSPLSPQAIQAGLSIAAFALVLPLAWSSILPNSPAMRLLQKSSWALPGQLAFTASAVFLTWLGANWLHLWWSAQPAIAESGNATLLTISSLIAGTLVPALSWATMTPEAWIAHIEQARQVRRLEHAMRMEEAAMRASYARAVSLLNAGLCNLTIDQRKELGGILGGFARVQQQALRAIGESWKTMYGVDHELGLVDDDKLIESYGKVVNLLADGNHAMIETIDRADEAESRDAYVSAHVPQRDHVNTQAQTVQTRDAQQGRAVQGTATHYVESRDSRNAEDEQAYDLWILIGPNVPKIVIAKDIQTAMRWQDITPAKRLIARWVDIGILEAIPNRPGRYSRVEVR